MPTNGFRSLLLLLAAATPSLAGNFTFTTIAVPGATTTFLRGINNSGQIVGDYFDAGGSHAFLYSAGTFTTLNIPDSEAFSINNSGQIVGSTGNDAFFYDGATFNILDVPGAQYTQGFGLNDNGAIVGSYGDADGNHGFMYQSGVFQTLNEPDAVNSTTLRRIDNAGLIVGYGFESFNNAFEYQAGTFTPLAYPGFRPSTDDVFVQGLNNNGVLVGSAFTNSGGHPFLFSAGLFTSVNLPGTPYGINDLGLIVGLTAVGNSYVGYLATPEVPEPATSALLAIGALAMLLRKRRLIAS